MRKFVIIILAVLILIFLGGTVLYLKFGKKQPAGVPNQQLKIERAKENALTKVLETNQRGDILIAEKPEYRITYFQKENQFLISINKSPFDEIRDEAEGEFQKITQADRGTLCKLNVKVSTPSFANPSLAGKNFPLSFCNVSGQ
jgi:hypothetical protein